MGTCTRSSSLLPSWPPLSLLDPQHTEPLLLMPQRSFPLSLLLMSMESMMTTARLTSRRQKHKMPTVLSRVASRLLFLMVVSRPPPTPLTTPTDSWLRSPMREPLSTPQSPQVDTDTPPLPTSPLLKFQYILMKKPNLLLQILPRLMSEAVSFSHGNLLLVFKKFPNYFSLLILFNLLSFSFIYLFIYGNKTD